MRVLCLIFFVIFVIGCGESGSSATPFSCDSCTGNFTCNTEATTCICKEGFTGAQCNVTVESLMLYFVTLDSLKAPAKEEVLTDQKTVSINNYNHHTIKAVADETYNGGTLQSIRFRVNRREVAVNDDKQFLCEPDGLPCSLETEAKPQYRYIKSLDDGGAERFYHDEIYSEAPFYIMGTAGSVINSYRFLAGPTDLVVTATYSNGGVIERKMKINIEYLPFNSGNATNTTNQLDFVSKHTTTDHFACNIETDCDHVVGDPDENGYGGYLVIGEDYCWLDEGRRIKECNHAPNYLITNKSTPSESLVSETESKYYLKNGVIGPRRICVRPGRYDRIVVGNLIGTEASPIIVSNCGGEVTVNSVPKYAKNPKPAMQLSYSRYLSIVGNGDPEILYGFRVVDSAKGTPGLYAGDFSRDFELAYIHIENPTGFDGISAKTNYGDSEERVNPFVDEGEQDKHNYTTYTPFVQTNTKIHHNLIENTGTGEGFYIGYFGCDGTNDDKPRLRGLEVNDNIIINTAADGMQIGCGQRDIKIHNNIIRNPGAGCDNAVTGNSAHWTGIQIGGMSVAEVYNNFVDNSNSVCMILIGGERNVDDVYAIKAYNNIFSNCSAHPTTNSAIYLHNLLTDNYDEEHPDGRRVLVANNTFINQKPGNHIINVTRSTNLHFDFHNNLMHLAGDDTVFTTNNGTYDTPTKCKMPDQEERGTECPSYNLTYNLRSGSLDDLMFQDYRIDNEISGDFMLQAGSPAIDAGLDLTGRGITTDLAGRARGTIFDLGVFAF